MYWHSLQQNEYITQKKAVKKRILKMILLMEEILHHLECIKPVVNNGINYQPQLVSRISEPSTVKI